MTEPAGMPLPVVNKLIGLLGLPTSDAVNVNVNCTPAVADIVEPHGGVGETNTGEPCPMHGLTTLMS